MEEINQVDKRIVDKLLIKLGYPISDQLIPLAGGANNRVFCVQINQQKLFLKKYFRHSGDDRDRLKSEFSFSKFAWEVGIRCIPQPIGYDQELGIALFQYITGKPVIPMDINEKMIEQAIQFYLKVNQHRDLRAAKNLPFASEAYIKISDHINCVDRRLERLQNIFSETDIDKLAIEFINQQLKTAWLGIKNSLQSKAVKEDIIFERNIPDKHFRLSPSDFGFHNAVLNSSGELTFFDFEYAGWDDPAKMVCDFFCQPAIPIPQDYLKMFIEKISVDVQLPEELNERIFLLLPVYQIKWICIMMNEFLPVSKERRAFANGEKIYKLKKVNQLSKAKLALEKILR